MTGRRDEQLRIQALGAALSRRDWQATEQAYNAIRDHFDACRSTHAVVPREPTTAMLAAGQRAWLDDPQKLSSTLFKAMVHAAAQVSDTPPDWKQDQAETSRLPRRAIDEAATPPKAWLEAKAEIDAGWPSQLKSGEGARALIPAAKGELAAMVYEAVRFANFAVGEGFCPAPGCTEAKDPAAFLSDFLKFNETDDYEAIAAMARNAILAPVEPAAIVEAARTSEPEAIAKLREFDRLGLVIESAVRNADAPNWVTVSDLIKRTRVFMSILGPPRRGDAAKSPPDPTNGLRRMEARDKLIETLEIENERLAGLVEQAGDQIKARDAQLFEMERQARNSEANEQ